MTLCSTQTNNNAGVQAHLVVTHYRVVAALETPVFVKLTSLSRLTLLTVYTTTVAPTHLFLSSNMTSKKSQGFGADEPEVEELLLPVVEEEIKEEKKPRRIRVVEPKPTTEPKLEPLAPPAPPAPKAPVEKKKLHRIIKRR